MQCKLTKLPKTAVLKQLFSKNFFSKRSILLHFLRNSEDTENYKQTKLRATIRWFPTAKLRTVATVQATTQNGSKKT